MLKKTMPRMLALAVVFVFAGCGDDPTDPPERLITTLECLPGASEQFNCAMTLPESTGFAVTLQNSDCRAHGNTVHLLKPVDQILTTDGCYAPIGSEWLFAGPYDAGTAVAMEIVSAKLANPPGVELVGEYPTWTIYFEDGDDDDFDDLVLTVSADQ